MIAPDVDGWNDCSKRLPADGDGAEMEQFVKGGNLAIILHTGCCVTQIFSRCARGTLYKVVAATEKERAGSFSVRWSRSRRSRTV